ncbi:MAG: hypothetical protein FD131_4416 [Rhodocyclaceae bacterium]|nr:MAG: hypothetical protein FD131_4416 [Rhodocyclaceae bacterium]
MFSELRWALSVLVQWLILVGAAILGIYLALFAVGWILWLIGWLLCRLLRVDGERVLQTAVRVFDQWKRWLFVAVVMTAIVLSLIPSLRGWFFALAESGLDFMPDAR